jgi:molybdate/tungstate transport system ATP-binding protein
MKPRAISVEDVSLGLGAFSLRNVTLALAPGEIVALLGPNGAGKSVTLETIAGFHRPRAGRIAINGRDVTFLPPELRRVGLLFQNYGLFPHLTVAANVAFGLGIRGRAGRSRPPVVGQLLARFRIDHLANRLPHDLSSGEKQRTALARALVMQPELFLFDEPFSALDARTRDTLREELCAFFRESAVPTIFVTHDHTDATVLADRVAIMDRGQIVQAGPVAEVFRAPANSFVADFTGVENRLPGRVISRDGPHWQIAIGNRLLHVDAARMAAAANVFLCIRGEDVTFCATRDPAPSRSAVNRLTMRVVRVIALGALCKVVLDGGFPLIACLTRRGAHDLGLVPGGDAVVEIEPDSIHLLAT